MNIFKQIGASVYGPAYYRDLLAKPFSHSLKYFVKLALLVALLGSVVASVLIAPRIKTFSTDISADALSYYPDELEVVIKGGNASANVPQPYSIPLPVVMREGKGGYMDDKEVPTNLIVIDTMTEYSLSRFDELDTAVLLTKDSLIYRENQGKVTVMPLKQIPDFVLNEMLISEVVSKIQPIAKFAIPLIVPLVFLVLCFYMSAKLLYLLLLALGVLLIVRSTKVSIEYGKAFQLSLHLMTFGVLWMLMRPLLMLPHIPFLYTASVLILAYVNFRPMQAKLDLTGPAQTPASPLK